MTQYESVDPYEKYKIEVEYENDLSTTDYCADKTDLEFCTKSNIQSIELFEEVMDILEKEWYKHLQSQINNLTLLKAQGTCDICTNISESDNVILICQGCGISVHRECYGSCFAEEDFFLCQPCLFYNRKKECTFCKKMNGLMKITTDFKFGHILCAMFCNYLDFDNPISKEPIAVQKNWIKINGKCKFCKKEENMKLECSYSICINIYHLECGLDKVYFDTKNNLTYCDLHDPTKKTKLFYCNMSYRNLVAGYVELKEKPVVRKRVQMSEQVETDYIKIVKSNPVILEDVYSKLNINIEKDILDGICKYWIAKKSFCEDFLLTYLRFRFNKKSV